MKNLILQFLQETLQVLLQLRLCNPASTSWQAHLTIQWQKAKLDRRLWTHMYSSFVATGAASDADVMANQPMHTDLQTLLQVLMQATELLFPQ